MYRSNRSFNMPPPGNPPGIWLFWKLLFKFPPTRAEMPFKCPTFGSIQVIKCPHPGDISQAQKWQKSLQLSNKIFINITKTEKHSLCLRIYYEQKSRAKRRKSLLQNNWMLSFFRHATYKAFYKKRSHPGGRGRLYCFRITFIDTLLVPVWRHIATGECFALLLQISMGRHRGENNRGKERQNARLISLLFANLIVSVCALLLLLSVCVNL